jgi:hypothetical protein
MNGLDILRAHFYPATDVHAELEKFWGREAAATDEIPPQSTKQQRAQRRPSVSQAIRAAEREGKTVVGVEATREGVKLTFAGEESATTDDYWDKKLR